MTHAIVSGGDSGFFDYLFDLIASIKQNVQRRDLEICLYDFGLTPEQIATLSQDAVVIKDPGWDIPFPNIETAPGYKKYVTAAPFAPVHFPGYETYVWIDADAWVQTPEAIDLLIAGAARRGMAACQEADRHYPSPLSGGKIQRWPLPGIDGYRRGVVTWLDKMLRRHYSRAIADEAFFAPVINAGVYAVAADAPHWAAWERSLRAMRSVEPRRLSDQVPLNHALHHEKLPIELLPARCNWLCSFCAPVYDPERGLLVEPMLPHEPIGIIHLLNVAKQRDERLRTVAGEATQIGLRFRDQPGR